MMNCGHNLIIRVYWTFCSRNKGFFCGGQMNAWNIKIHFQQIFAYLFYLIQIVFVLNRLTCQFKYNLTCLQTAVILFVIKHPSFLRQALEESVNTVYKKLKHLRGFEIPTQFAVLGASNAFRLQGTLPEDSAALTAAFDKIIGTVREDDLREYRKNLHHL